MPETAIKLPPTIAVRDLAVKLGLPITTVAGELIKNGIMSSMNEEIDFDTASIIAEDLGKSVELDTVVPLTGDEPLSIEHYLQEGENVSLKARPPVVVVLGHVDHGKTSLLDTIRGTDVIGSEAGGITQHIGAYQISQHNRLITFIDTPGHEAFIQMRTRGAKIADVAILVIAADDGIKPQTLETLKIIREAAIPFIVAITKIDKPDANIAKVKKELADQEVLVEDFGGKVPAVGVSSKSKEGLTELLESVLLLADVEAAKLQVDADRQAIGTIIESHVDPQQGPLASVLIQTGTLKIGDDVIVGQVWGKVRSLKNDRGESVKVAPPSMPVQILGLKAAPQVGDILRVSTADSQDLKRKVKSHQMGHHLQTVVGRKQSISLTKKQKEEEGDTAKPQVKKLFLILKTDTVGSAEAIVETLKTIQHPEVAVEVVQRGLGIITEAEVLRAEAGKAQIFGFHVQVSPKAEQLARSKEVVIKTYKVIYDLKNEVIQILEDLLPPQIEEKEIGKLKVLAVFRNENTFQVVGGKVMDGMIQMNAHVRVMRGDAIITEGAITQLQSNKQNVKEVSSGSEAGLKVEGKPLIGVGDMIVAHIIESTKRKLV